ncbi:fibronectin type III domain-containing protein [Arthrobacter sp. JZ12]|uniref:fibronectin type III domain-containing protein n=1 Tax=Arthrobacter sp. JZ12 TaxID=2654190 RepID=UPI002B491E18|nr:fibronectin type III domain-containing protein [Arthrobacter sp. JZ12]
MPKTPPLRRAFTTALLAATAAAGLTVLQPVQPVQAAPEAEPAATAEQISSFTLGVLPDTQFYSRYATSDEGRQFQARYGTEPFSAQTGWLVDAQDELGIPFVTHLGDVVDQANKPQQWEVADAAMKVLEAGNLPYSVLAGNHDVLSPCEGGEWCSELNRNLNAEPFPRTFSKTRAANQATFGGRDATGFHEYHVFEREGEQYLVLALSWQASDQGMAWAQEVIDAHPGLPTILTSHQILNIGTDGVTAVDTAFGNRLWDRLIAKNNQIFMTLSGHHHGNAHRVKMNDAGAPVLQVVNDYQMAYQGGNGYLGLYEFDFTNSQIHANQVSPWVVQKPAETVTEFDQAVLTGDNEQYSVPFDLTKRFTEIDATFTAPPADHTSYSRRAIDMLLENWTEPERPDVTPPSNPEDYFTTANTVAHWRFDGNDGDVFPVGGTVTDLTGDNPLTRAPLINGAEEVDVTISSDAHRLAPSQTSMCFTNTDRRTDRLSYLATAASAPLNDNRFENGYTVETFLKIDPDWTYDGHRWMTALASGGTRGGSVADRELAPFFAAISSLREVQWSVNGQGGAKTNWSGEIMPNQWIHVAAVNDPSTRTTTLYVDGAPVLRNTSDILGINTHADLPWMLGAGTEWGTPSAGWFGCIGETRIVEQPLSSDQWLTARAEVPSDQTGKAAFSDDFERANGELGADWKVTRGGWAVVDGTARNTAPSGLDNLAIAGAQELGDHYTVSSTVSVANLNNPRQWVGLASNVHGEGTDDQGYYLLRFAPNEASDTGRWQFARVDAGHRITGLAPISTYNHPRNEPVVVTLTREGSQLTGTLSTTDGTEIMSETYTVPSTSGHAGGLAALYSNTGDTIADNFRIATSADASAPEAPAAPSLAVAGRDVTVRWSAPECGGGSPLTGYTVTLTGPEGDTVRDLPADATSVVFEGLRAGDYTATVTAVNSLGSSPVSAAPGPVTVQPELPSVIAEAPALRMDGDSLLVTWVAPENDGGAAVTEYVIELRAANGRTTVISVDTADPAFTDPVSGFRITDYTNGRFTATVAAVNAAGQADASPSSAATTVAPGLGVAAGQR